MSGLPIAWRFTAKGFAWTRMKRYAGLVLYEIDPQLFRCKAEATGFDNGRGRRQATA